MSDDVPAGPVEGPPRGTGDSTRKQYRLGLGLGMIPVVVAWLALGIGLRTNGGALTGALTTATIVSFGLLVLAAVVCLSVREWRRLGYGLLTMVFVGPVIWSVGCIVLLSSVHPA